MKPENPYIKPNWVGEIKISPPDTVSCFRGKSWQEGFDALKTWLFESCTEHDKEYWDDLNFDTKTLEAYKREYGVYPSRNHKECPECMKELVE